MVRGLSLCCGSFSPAVHWEPVKNNAEKESFTFHIEMDRQHLDFCGKQKKASFLTIIKVVIFQIPLIILSYLCVLYRL